MVAAAITAAAAWPAIATTNSSSSTTTCGPHCPFGSAPAFTWVWPLSCSPQRLLPSPHPLRPSLTLAASIRRAGMASSRRFSRQSCRSLCPPGKLRLNRCFRLSTTTTQASSRIGLAPPAGARAAVGLPRLEMVGPSGTGTVSCSLTLSSAPLGIRLRGEGWATSGRQPISPRRRWECATTAARWAVELAGGTWG